MKYIGIVGSRRRNSFPDYIKVHQAFLSIYNPGDRIVSGGCPQGADHFAEQIAKKEQVPILIHYAQWNKCGKAAGFIRNGDIAQEATTLIACVAEDRTGGTEDTIKKFLNEKSVGPVTMTEEQAIQSGRLILV